VDHTPYGAGPNKFSRARHGAYFKPFSKVDRKNPSSFLLHFLDRIELTQRRDARLVDHDILPSLHCLNGDISAL
jgi:hypothetical protein